MSRIRKSPFTLIEMMVACFLIVIAGSIIGINSYKAIQKKQFQSKVESLKAKLLLAQKMALVTQTDLTAGLKREKKRVVFQTNAEKNGGFLNLEDTVIYLDEKKVNEVNFFFYSQGKITPLKKIQLKKGDQMIEVDLQKLFAVQEK